MTTRRRGPRPARRIWVFSEPNPALTPSDLARVIAREAIRAARLAEQDAKGQTQRSQKERPDAS